ncbi:hypothetical protein HDV00_006064 [Rhizophlyctis rosea]|nr:hypothetical protein HDV00_006064 [Rhizophlyctis rosea]
MARQNKNEKSERRLPGIFWTLFAIAGLVIAIVAAIKAPEDKLARAALSFAIIGFMKDVGIGLLALWKGRLGKIYSAIVGETPTDSEQDLSNVRV